MPRLAQNPGLTHIRPAPSPPSGMAAERRRRWQAATDVIGVRALLFPSYLVRIVWPNDPPAYLDGAPPC